MKTMKHLLMTAMFVSLAMPPGMAGTIGSYPAKTTLAGTEKIMLDDSGTDKHVTVSNLGAAARGGLTITTTTGTFTVSNGKTFSVGAGLSFLGTDGTEFTFPSASGTVVTTAGTQTLSGKTLTAAKLADGGFLADANGNELIIGVTTSSAVNEITVTNAATGAGPTLAASGETNVPLNLKGKGTGDVRISDGTDATKRLLFELSGATTAKTLTLASSHTDDRTLTAPDATGAIVVSTLTTNAPDAANSVSGASNGLVFEGATANSSETTVTVTDPTADRTITWPDASGVPILAAAVADAANALSGGTGTLIWEGATADTYELTLSVTDLTADRAVVLPDNAGTLMLSTLSTNGPDAANAVWGASAALVFEGSTADTAELTLTLTDPTADRTITLPNAAGAVLLSAGGIADAANAISGGTGTLIFEGSTADTAELTLAVTDPTADRTVTFPNATGTVLLSALSTNAQDAANAIWGVSNGLSLEGATADAYELTLAPTDPTADRTVTFPDATGVVLLVAAVADAANAISGGTGTFIFEGATADSYETTIGVTDPTADRSIVIPDGAGTVMLSSLATNATDAANAVTGASNGLVFEGATANASETTVTVTDPTADRTVTIPDATGTMTLAQASTTTTLTADDQAVTPGSATRLQLASDNATAANRTFTLSATGAITGQIYVLIGPASNQCELADTGIQKLSAVWSPTATDTLTLLFDGTNFIELCRADN